MYFTSEEPQGGLGGCLLEDPRHWRSDARMIERAVRKSYGLTNEDRERLARRLMLIAFGKLGGKPRDWIAAARALLAADAIDTQRDKMATPQQVNMPHDDRPFFAHSLEERTAFLDKLAADLSLGVAAGADQNPRAAANGDRSAAAPPPL